MITGFFYAILYFTVKNRFLGFTISGWLKNLPLLLAVIAFLFGWSIAWMAFGLILAILIRLFYWKARRDGYIRFMVDESQAPKFGSNLLEADKRVALQATGFFSVKDWEDYVLQSPAEYWRVPVGDHTLMVNHSPGRYLYQFIRPGLLDIVRSGKLCYGRKASKALELIFLTDWQPENDQINFRFYAPEEEEETALIRRRVYLSFENDADKLAVWQSLLVFRQTSSDG